MSVFPLISILIPLYNAEHFLIETLESCLNQTYENIEIIVVDDGSTDNSLNVAREYEKRHQNITVYTQANSGAQRARNLAFEKSKGSYVQYLDADDLLSKDKVASQMALVQKYGDENVYTTKFVRFKDNIDEAQYTRRGIDRSFESGIEWLIASWSGAGMGQTSIWLTPRGLIEKAGEWNESLSKNQDGEFFCRVLLNTCKVIYSDEASVYYRETGNTSISYQMTEKAGKATLLSYKLYEENTEKITSLELKKALAYCYLSFINHYYPKFPILIKEAESSIHRLGFNFDLLEQQGKLYRVSRLIGFKNSMRLRHFAQKINLLRNRK